MLKFKLFIVFFAILITSLSAQNNPSTQLAGYWKMYNSAWDFENKNYLKIIPKEDGHFDAFYLINNETVDLQGIIFGEKQISINEVSANSSKNIYNGEIENNGSINGYYASKAETLGRFSWVKICDESGKALNSYDLPCAQAVPTSYETYTTTITTTEPVITTTKKVIQTKEVVEYVGEARNPNIPLAETVSDIPANAIIVGHIGLDSIVTYKNVEVEIPVEASVTSTKIVTKSKNSASTNSKNNATSSGYTSKKVMSESAKEKQKAIAESNSKKIGEITDVLTSRGVEAVPAAYDFHDNTPKQENASASAKFGTCDPGNKDVSTVISKMEKGTTINENGHVYHIVGKGETMTAISRLYNIPIMRLAENNQKECERINVGEKLFIK